MSDVFSSFPDYVLKPWALRTLGRECEPFRSCKPKVKGNYLVVFLQDVVHFGHILTRDGLDDVSFVVRRVESGPAPCLGVVGKGRAPGQGILPVEK